MVVGSLKRMFLVVLAIALSACVVMGTSGCIATTLYLMQDDPETAEQTIGESVDDEYQARNDEVEGSIAELANSDEGDEEEE